MIRRSYIAVKIASVRRHSLTAPGYIWDVHDEGGSRWPGDPAHRPCTGNLSADRGEVGGKDMF